MKALIVRFGLVQASIGAMIVIMTSTLNRVMVIELGLPALVPGALVALHFLVQLLLRPRLGHGSDRSGRRTPWVVGGMVLLALSAIGASASTLVIAIRPGLGLAAAALAFLLLGAGVSAAGTSLLALLAELVPAETRARAAATVWLMMIAGFVLTTVLVSLALEPFSLGRLVAVTAAAGAVAVAVAVLAVTGIERRATPAEIDAPSGSTFGAAVREVWSDRGARTFAGFVFVSMLAYSAQDLILEPFAGRVFGLSPAASTRVSSLHQGGMLLGMIVTGLLAARRGSLRAWASGGCLASGVAFLALSATPALGSLPALNAAILVLGVANGAFAIGAVGSMMSLSVSAGGRSAGVRMGVFGAAQAVAYAIGGFAGAAGSDVAARVLGTASQGYTTVFLGEAAMFVVAGVLALRSAAGSSARAAVAGRDAGDSLLTAMG